MMTQYQMFFMFNYASSDYYRTIEIFAGMMPTIPDEQRDQVAELIHCLVVNSRWETYAKEFEHFLCDIQDYYGIGYNNLSSTFEKMEAAHYKVPYDKFPKDRRRQCVFVGTSNKQRFLPLDRTGNRRFYPIQTNIEEAEVHVLDNENATREYMRQLWAELMVIYRSGNWSLTLPPEMEHRLGVFRMNFMAEDTSTGMV